MKKASPALVAVLIVAIVGGIGFVLWKTISGGLSGGGEAQAVVVKPDNPDDPKYRPDPRLGLSGGGG